MMIELIQRFHDNVGGTVADAPACDMSVLDCDNGVGRIRCMEIVYDKFGRGAEVFCQIPDKMSVLLQNIR